MKATTIEDDADEATTPVGVEPTKKVDPTQNLPFQVKALHKKALLQLLQSHHTETFPTYAQLSMAIGVGEKTKSWQCEAWKHLYKNDFIVVANASKGNQRTFTVSPKGIELANWFCSPEELAEYKAPLSNEELHDTIRKRLAKDSKTGKHKHSGVRILDALLDAHNSDRGGLTRLELAYKLGTTNPDSHGFFYGFAALQKQKLVIVKDTITRDELKRKYEELQKSKDGDKDAEGDAAPPKAKKRKSSVRLRGGCQLFVLSDKAFLAATPAPVEQAPVLEK